MLACLRFDFFRKQSKIFEKVTIRNKFVCDLTVLKMVQDFEKNLNSTPIHGLYKE